MGADVHLYIQYKTKKSNYWNSFAGRINPGRNYIMFSLMAKVRGEYPESLDPKGLPEHELSYQCANDLFLYIDEKDDEGCTSLENALKWNKNNGCKIVNDKNGNPWKVEHPDWHSHSWLKIKEMKQVFKNYAKIAVKEWGSNKIPTEYQAVLDVMKSLKKSGNEVKVVFWFDN